MTRGGRIFIIIGVLLGLGTIGAAVWLMSQGTTQPADVPAEAQMTTAVIALQNIEAKTEIPAEAIGTKEVPVSTMPENPIVSPGAVVGRMSGQDILQGEIISKDMIVDKSQIAKSGVNASLGVPPGMVAVSFRVGESERRVEGAIQSGDHVDILVSYTFEEQRPSARDEDVMETLTKRVTQLALQDVEILKVGTWRSGPAPSDEEEAAAQAKTEPGVFTVLLARQDALVLKYMLEGSDKPPLQGMKIDLLLRGAGDEEIVSTEAVTLEYMLTRFSVPQITFR
jgi:Flp pilus assembly protein CpaB